MIELSYHITFPYTQNDNAYMPLSYTHTQNTLTPNILFQNFELF